MSPTCTRCGQPCAAPGARFCPQCGDTLGESGLTPGASSLTLDAPGAAPRCAAHAAAEASGLCSRCGAFACAACLQSDAGAQPLCAACAARVQSSHWEIPWERREDLGLVRAYFATIMQVVLSPRRSFRGMEPEGRWWDAMSFAIVSTALSSSSAFVAYLRMVGAADGASLGIGSAASPATGRSVFAYLGIAAVLAVSIPLGTIVQAYVLGGIHHLALKVLGAGSRGFRGTLRAYCYCTAPGILGIVPFVGLRGATICEVILAILAYKEVHRVGWARPLVAVMLPMTSCCCAFIGFYQIFNHSTQ